PQHRPHYLAHALTFHSAQSSYPGSDQTTATTRAVLVIDMNPLQPLVYEVLRRRCSLDIRDMKGHNLGSTGHAFLTPVPQFQRVEPECVYGLRRLFHQFV